MEILDPPLPPIAIPFAALSPEASQGVLEDFILREGTDYGEGTFTLEQKTAQVQKQIAQGTIRLVFDPNEETVTLVTDHEWRIMMARAQTAG